MQWWRDAISGMYDGGSSRDDDAANANDYRGRDDDGGGYLAFSPSARRNPTIRSLAYAVRTHDLTHRFLSRIVEAREADLDVAQHGRVRDVAQYGEDTMSNVLYLTLECLGVSIRVVGRTSLLRPNEGEDARLCALPFPLFVVVPLTRKSI